MQKKILPKAISIAIILAIALFSFMHYRNASPQTLNHNDPKQLLCDAMVAIQSKNSALLLNCLHPKSSEKALIQTLLNGGSDELRPGMTLDKYFSEKNDMLKLSGLSREQIFNNIEAINASAPQNLEAFWALGYDATPYELKAMKYQPPVTGKLSAFFINIKSKKAFGFALMAQEDGRWYLFSLSEVIATDEKPTQTSLKPQPARHIIGLDQ